MATTSFILDDMEYWVRVGIPDDFYKMCQKRKKGPWRNGEK